MTPKLVIPIHLFHRIGSLLDVVPDKHLDTKNEILLLDKEGHTHRLTYNGKLIDQDKPKPSIRYKLTTAFKKDPQ